MAKLEAREYSKIVKGSEGAPSDVASDCTRLMSQRKKKHNALGDKPLRAVQSCTKSAEIWSTLFERYSGTTVACQITVLTSLMNMRLPRDKYMGEHVSEMESHMNRLVRMNMELAESMQVSMLLVSLSGVHEYTSTISVVKTMEAEMAT